ncbi:MAG TPA: hypothetical protein PLE74_02650 [Candidatus Cloacimonadota bacterium]|nr:hypothetical protein [Candidatus Cloacimonadota bacterium]HPT71163.1 hypothetical protein [Candidatus Cloacimonadota bacterium]
MRKLYLLTILMVTIIPCFAKVSLELASDFTYDSNIYQLSDYDMDRYKNSEPTLSYINSADDVIWGSSLKLQYQTRWNNIRIRPSFKASANRFLDNVDKSNANGLATLALMHRFADLNLSYGYYPDNYLRKYKDKDGTGLYEKFQYDKNLYKADSYINLMKHESLYLYLKYEQYDYNKYFTEYDGNATTTGIGWRHTNPQLTFNGTYYYRQFDEKKNTDLSGESADAAYESNIYDFGLTWKNWKPLIGSHVVNIRPSFSVSWEDRYYEGTDAFHNGRQDAIVDIVAGVTVPVQKNLDISLDFSHTMRNVSSNSLSVPRYKDYKETTVSAGFSYSIDLMR